MSYDDVVQRAWRNHTLLAERLDRADLLLQPVTVFSVTMIGNIEVYRSAWTNTGN